MSRPETPRLRPLQSWMQAVITDPGGLQAGLASGRAQASLPVRRKNLESVVLPSRQLSAEERLGIYANSYFLRLIEVLENDFRGLRATLGEEAFAELSRRYLALNPSTSYTLNALGADLPDFVAEDPSFGEGGSFLSELARLERAVEEVFDETPSARLAVEELEAIPPESWPGARVRLIAASRLHAFEHPVNDYLQAVLDGETPEIPAPRATHVLVHRPQHVVRRLDLDPEPFAILSALAEGRTLGEALEAALEVPGVDAQALVAGVQGWFQDWAGFGIISAVQTGA